MNATRATLVSQKSANVIVITRTVQLKGTVSKIGSDGEQVVIQAKPAGTSSYTVAARTVTHKGFWSVTLKPRRTTAYRAVWMNVPSRAHVVHVKPLVRLKQVGRSLFSVGLHADTTLLKRRVMLQRFRKPTHKWSSFARLRLTHFKASKSEYDSIGSIRLTLPHGVIIRAYISRAQAGPLMWGPAWSLGRRT